MPPRRRSVSVEPSRKSTRVIPPSPAKSAAPAPPTPKKAAAANKRARSVSVARSIREEDEGSDDGEKVTVNGTRKRKAATPAPPKIPKPRVPISGINPLPTLYSSFPAFDSFTFPVPPALALPEAKEAPRKAFVFGNGDFGQHGLGVDEKVLCEIKRPRNQKWFEEKIAKSRGEEWVDPDKKEDDSDDEDGEKKIEEDKKEEEVDKSWEGGIAHLVCGGMHTLAVDGQGKVWSWGINDNAALGRSTSIPGIESEELETQPMLVEGLQEEGFKAVRVAAGDSVSLAISELGEVRCWGSFRASEGLLGFDGKAGSSLTQLKPVALPNLNQHTIVQLATGDDHFLALTSKGQVFACGNGEQGQLGRKIIQRHKTNGLTPERLALKNIALIGSGSYHSFAVTTAGEVYSWGLNSFSQCGVAPSEGGWADSIPTPTLVSSLSPALHSGSKVIQIEGGVHHSVFLFDNGEVYACGRCDGHECGLGEDSEAMKKSEERKEEALKERRARAVDEEQRLVGSGAGEDGTGGMSSEEAAIKAAEAAAQGIPLPNPHIPEPERLSFPSYTTPDGKEEPTKIIQIACGTRHNFAVSLDGRVFAWGVGNTSQLGLGDEEEAEVPTEVKSVKLNGKGEVKGNRTLWASTGGQHSVVVAVQKK